MMASRILRTRLVLAGCLCCALFLAACGRFALPAATVLPGEAPLGADQGPQAGRAALPTLRLAQGRVLPAPSPDLALPVPFPPPPAVDTAVRDYVPPVLVPVPAGGHGHFLGFDLTPALAGAMRAWAAGDPGQMLASLDAVDRDADNPPGLAWQAMLLRARARMLEGRPDLAEDELARAEPREIALTGSNFLVRALRAEARLWAGDPEAALADGLAVAQAIGTWSMPVRFLTQPSDHLSLGAAALAQSRAVAVVGGALLSQGRLEEALPWLELGDRLLNVLFHLGTQPDTWGLFPLSPDLLADRGLSLACLGAALSGLDREPERAAELFARAEHVHHAAALPAGPVVTGMFKALGHLHAGRHAEAVQEALQARGHAENWDMMDSIWRLDTLRGEALARMGLPSDSGEALRRAQRLADRLAGARALSAAKARLGVTQRTLTLALMRLGAAQDDWDDLFLDAERSRSRELADLLTGRTVAVGRQTEAVARLRAMDREIVAERQRKQGTAGSAGARERELLYDREHLLEALRGLDPELAEVLGAHGRSLAEVRARLPLDSLLVVILPLERDEPARAVFLADDFLQLRQLPCGPSQLASRLKELAALRGSRENAPRQKEVLAALRQDLDLESWGRTSTLFVVPSGVFRFIPWGALDLPFPVAVLPEAGWLLRPPLALDPAQGPVILADPETGGAAPALAGTRTEARTVAEAVGGLILHGPQATETALREGLASGTSAAHLAALALPDTLHPLRSGLVLSDGTTAAPLTVERIFEYPLGARLTVLSSGQWGLGQGGSGAALAALERALALGGSSALVAGLWPVEDQATAAFMGAFHAALRENSVGQAWLKARDAARQAGYAPAEYGAFALYGSPGRVVPEDYAAPLAKAPKPRTQPTAKASPRKAAAPAAETALEDVPGIASTPKAKAKTPSKAPAQKPSKTKKKGKRTGK